MNKKLYRSEKNKMLLGVAGGLGEFFDVDPVLIRAIFAFLTLAGGSGVLLYFVLSIVIPKENEASGVGVEERTQEIAEELKNKAENLSEDIKAKQEKLNQRKRGSRRGSFFGIILMVLSFAILLDKFLPGFLKWDIVFAVLVFWMGYRIAFKKN